MSFSFKQAIEKTPSELVHKIDHHSNNVNGLVVSDGPCVLERAFITTISGDYGCIHLYDKATSATNSDTPFASFCTKVHVPQQIDINYHCKTGLSIRCSASHLHSSTTASNNVVGNYFIRKL